MSKKIIIEGVKQLNGTVTVHGAKNSVLPILAATVLNAGTSVIHDCPKIKDVYCTLEILKHIGCTVKWEDKSLTVDSSNIECHHIPDTLMREMRSSVIFLGAIVARCGKALITYPGGCELGPRPIDLHLKAFKELDIKIKETHGFLCCSAEKMKPCDIHLDFPSVGATENIMLATALCRGTTRIYNAAKEPEIVDLQNFLNSMGAKITGAGTPLIEITGVDSLSSTEHTLIPDRIVAATYLTAAAATGGFVEVKNVIYEHVEPVASVLRDCGCVIEYKKNHAVAENTATNTATNMTIGSVLIKNSKRLKAADYIRTMPHPGFPTDAQPQIVAALAVADGTSIVCENIFDVRFRYTQELNRMGADIKVDGRLAVVRGVDRLWGAKVKVPDLRAGAALVIAGLSAEGITELTDVFHIDRGYENLVDGFSALGAKIKTDD